jgi:hypothetical protein
VLEIEYLFMDVIIVVHTIFGERVLPILIIAAAVWFTISWKPDQGRTLPGRVFVWLVAIQFVLGLVQWVYGLIIGIPNYLSFPFLLHPVLGLLAVGVAHMGVNPKPGSFLARLGRWGPLAALALLLVIVLASIVTGMARLG